MKKFLAFLMLLPAIFFTLPLSAYEVLVIGYRIPGSNLGPYMGGTTPGGMTSANDMNAETYAKKMAAEAAGKEAEARAKKRWCMENNYPKTSDNMCEKVKAECESVKAGAVIDMNACIIDVGYRGNILSNKQCGDTSPTRTTGTINWAYGFKGKFYGFSTTIPRQSYDEFSWNSNQFQCESIINNAIDFIEEICESQALYAIHEKCEY